MVVVYLDDGGQCQLRKADHGGLGVEILQYEVIELLDQAILLQRHLLQASVLKLSYPSHGEKTKRLGENSQLGLS